MPTEVISIPKIATPLQNFATVNLHSLPHLKGLRLAHPITDEQSFEVDLLIGADQYWNVVEDQIIKGPGPTAAKSKIGYLLSGPVPSSNQSSTLNANILYIMTEPKEVEMQLERFWNLESIEILPNEATHENTEFLRHYQDTSITLKDGRYHAKLPWKQDPPNQC